MIEGDTNGPFPSKHFLIYLGKWRFAHTFVHATRKSRMILLMFLELKKFSNTLVANANIFSNCAPTLVKQLFVQQFSSGGGGNVKNLEFKSLVL